MKEPEAGPLRDPQRKNRARRCGLLDGRLAVKLVCGIALCQAHIDLLALIEKTRRDKRAR